MLSLQEVWIKTMEVFSLFNNAVFHNTIHYWPCNQFSLFLGCHEQCNLLSFQGCFLRSLPYERKFLVRGGSHWEGKHYASDIKWQIKALLWFSSPWKHLPTQQGALRSRIIPLVSQELGRFHCFWQVRSNSSQLTAANTAENLSF